jgi:hypothetical protein
MSEPGAPGKQPKRPRPRPRPPKPSSPIGPPTKEAIALLGEIADRSGVTPEQAHRVLLEELELQRRSPMRSKLLRTILEHSHGTADSIQRPKKGSGQHSGRPR